MQDLGGLPGWPPAGPFGLAGLAGLSALADAVRFPAWGARAAAAHCGP
jgi:hypothetical protein